MKATVINKLHVLKVFLFSWVL